MYSSMDKKSFYIFMLISMLLFGCGQHNSKKSKSTSPSKYLVETRGILDFKGVPKDKDDRDMLMFSDQGAWFAYSLPENNTNYGGFSGPFLMTQDNGVWSSPSMVRFAIQDSIGLPIIWDKLSTNSYNSHLEQNYENKTWKVEHQLVFMSGHTALQRIIISNISDKEVTLNSTFQGNLFDIGLNLSKENGHLKLTSPKSKAVGYIQFLKEGKDLFLRDSSSYVVNNQTLLLKPRESTTYLISETFIFPEYSWSQEMQLISKIDFDSILKIRKIEKEKELSKLIQSSKPQFNDRKYARVLAKARLTLQNNWRITAGGLKHEGLFPSYHYEWFQGFWSWDSWKHAVGLSYYNIDLAKNQIRAMFDYQSEDGFVLDCIYRDNLIEENNYRDTKPPLSAWAVVKIYKKDRDIDFVRELYPKLKKYHSWWYQNRDHDKDGVCEYGCTDGTLIAAKWESGMDNAIRFDNSKILKNSDGAYSLNQESVDLNAYLYAEKLYLATLAEALGKTDEANTFQNDAEVLKKRIQQQFYDPKDGWFYDTDLEGTVFIKGAGSEGWTALWAKAATHEQAVQVKKSMMDPKKFYTKVPFQTMSADHPKFNPLKGYWRGPNWLDQAYFGVKGLRNYGFDQEADMATKQILEGAEGILNIGSPIYENYHPLTGKGLNAKNFSWSAAHIIMLLTKDE